jgi:DNA-binding NtrC family response regulator
LPEAREFLRHATYQGQRTGRPVVIVYADQPNFETMGEMILDGAAEFLMKPFSKDLLQFKLKQAGVLAH